MGDGDDTLNDWVALEQGYFIGVPFDSEDDRDDFFTMVEAHDMEFVERHFIATSKRFSGFIPPNEEFVANMLIRFPNSFVDSRNGPSK